MNVEISWNPPKDIFNLFSFLVLIKVISIIYEHTVVWYIINVPIIFPNKDKNKEGHFEGLVNNVCSGSWQKGLCGACVINQTCWTHK